MAAPGGPEYGSGAVSFDGASLAVHGPDAGAGMHQASAGLHHLDDMEMGDDHNQASLPSAVRALSQIWALAPSQYLVEPPLQPEPLSHSAQASRSKSRVVEPLHDVSDRSLNAQGSSGDIADVFRDSSDTALAYTWTSPPPRLAAVAPLRPSSLLVPSSTPTPPPHAKQPDQRPRAAKAPTSFELGSSSSSSSSAAASAASAPAQAQAADSSNAGEAGVTSWGRKANMVRSVPRLPLPLPALSPIAEEDSQDGPFPLELPELTRAGGTRTAQRDSAGDLEPAGPPPSPLAPSPREFQAPEDQRQGSADLRAYISHENSRIHQRLARLEREVVASVNECARVREHLEGMALRFSDREEEQRWEFASTLAEAIDLERQTRSQEVSEIHRALGTLDSSLHEDVRPRNWETISRDLGDLHARLASDLAEQVANATRTFAAACDARALESAQAVDQLRREISTLCTEAVDERLRGWRREFTDSPVRGASKPDLSSGADSIAQNGWLGERCADAWPDPGGESPGSISLSAARSLASEDLADDIADEGRSAAGCPMALRGRAVSAGAAAPSVVPRQIMPRQPSVRAVSSSSAGASPGISGRQSGAQRSRHSK